MVSGQDVMAAMEDMELSSFKPQLEEALEAFRRDKTAKKDKKRAKDGSGKNISADGNVDSKLKGSHFLSTFNYLFRNFPTDWIILGWLHEQKRYMNDVFSGYEHFQMRTTMWKQRKMDRVTRRRRLTRTESTAERSPFVHNIHSSPFV